TTPGRHCYHPNHAAFYIGAEPHLRCEEDPALGGSGPFIYHHMAGRADARENYGWCMANRRRRIRRHEESPQ
ncbi:phage tail protein, partial [Pseudomonas aeruginosa]